MLVTKSNITPILKRLRGAKDVSLVVDLETNGLEPWRGNHMIGIALLDPRDEKAYYFPFRHQKGNLPSSALPRVIKILSQRQSHIGFNYKFDLGFLTQEGMPLPHEIEDVMLHAHLMNENEPSFKLENLAQRYLGEGGDEETELMERLAKLGYEGKAAKAHMFRLPPSKVAPYACADVRQTWKLRQFYQLHLEIWKLDELREEVDRYLLAVCRMEQRGLVISVPLIKDFILEADQMTGDTAQRIEKVAGYPVNPNSPKQVGALLEIKSTARAILETMTDNPIAELILEYRGWSKVSGTYYRPFLDRMEVDRSILHPNLSLIGTVSGRLSCSKPNLQAIPRQTSVYKVKEVFMARSGHTLVSVDYSQIEMRLATHYAGEKRMSEILLSGQDMHTTTANDMGVPRDIAKRINFGVIYGIGANALSEQLRIPKSVAKQYLNRYHTTYPGFRILYKRAERQAEERGYIRMWTGRVRRYSKKIPSHKAMSNLIQGGVAEIMRVAITRLDAIGYLMLLQVHDDIIFEIADDELEDSIPKIVEVMEDFDFTIPLIADVKIGKTWGDMRPWKGER